MRCRHKGVLRMRHKAKFHQPEMPILTCTRDLTFKIFREMAMDKRNIDPNLFKTRPCITDVVLPPPPSRAQSLLETAKGLIRERAIFCIPFQLSLTGRRSAPQLFKPVSCSSRKLSHFRSQKIGFASCSSFAFIAVSIFFITILMQTILISQAGQKLVLCRREIRFRQNFPR